MDDHAIVSYSGTPAPHLSAIRWLEIAGLDGKTPRKPAFSANSVIAMKYAIRAGIGIGLVPDYLIEEDTELVPVLREADLPTVPIYFVLPGGAEDREEGAGVPRLPGRQGAAVEVLAIRSRVSDVRDSGERSDGPDHLTTLGPETRGAMQQRMARMPPFRLPNACCACS